MAREQIDEAKITKLLEMMERNIEAECSEAFDCFRPSPPRAKPDRTLERALRAELSMVEQVEIDRRRNVKAKECWLAGDNERKNLWGGW
jgi:hypothetical protein